MTATTSRSPRRRRLYRAGLTASTTLALLATVVGAASPASAATRPTAENGERCTIVGTAGKDTLRGTKGRDVICGLGGNDVIKGLGGNDVLDGGEGKDTIQGGSGNDRIYGGAGKDTLSGDAGHDYLDGDTGADKLTGGSGDDVLSGGTNNDALNGGSGSDGLMGSSGRDTYVGSSGDDRCTYVVGEDVSRSSCVGDKSAPQVLGMTVNKTSVDSRSGDAKVTVSVQARDDMVAYVNMQLVGTGALSGTTLSGSGSWDEPSSGSPKNGTWTSTFTIPQGTPSGSYDVAVEATDGVHVTSTKKLYRSAVKHTGVTYTQPNVTSFATSAPPVIDTRTGTQKVTYKATIADPQQRMTKYADLSMVSVTGQTRVDLDGTLTRTGGTATNGTWTTSRTFTRGNWETDQYDWVLKTTSKEGRTTTWVGPTLWETTYKGKPGYKPLPGAQTFQVLGEDPTPNLYAPEMSSVRLPATVTVGTNGSAVPVSIGVSDFDAEPLVRGSVYLQSVEHPDVWFEGSTGQRSLDEEGNRGTLTGNVYVNPAAPRGEYRVWVLVTDAGYEQPGHYVWYGPAGAQPPSHVKTPGKVSVNPLTADMTTNGTTVTLK